jgi:hypothetical protein
MIMIGMVIFLSCYQRLLKNKKLDLKQLIDKVIVVVIALLVAGIIFGTTYLAASAPVDESSFKGLCQITQHTIPQPLEDVGENKVELFI